MKKIFIILAMLLAVATANAQRATEATVWEDNDINHSGLFLNPYVGAMVGSDGFSTKFGFGFDFGYRYYIASGFNWDILSVGFNSAADKIENWASVRFLTGIRYNSQPLVAGKSLYGNFNLGYQINTKHDKLSGFAYGVGAGINFTRLFSAGLTWEGNHIDGGNWGIFGVKLGFSF